MDDHETMIPVGATVKFHFAEYDRVGVVTRSYRDYLHVESVVDGCDDPVSYMIHQSNVIDL